MKEAGSSGAVLEKADEFPEPPIDPAVEHWLNREIQLNQMHEEILMQREALFGSTENYVGRQEDRSAVQQESEAVAKLKARNQKLLEDISRVQSNLGEDVTKPASPRFTTLQNNYWAMVKGVLPVWEEELLDYKQKHRGKPQSSPILQRSSPKIPRSKQKFQRHSTKIQRSTVQQRTMSNSEWTSPKVLRTSSQRSIRNSEPIGDRGLNNVYS